MRWKWQLRDDRKALIVTEEMKKKACVLNSINRCNEVEWSEEIEVGTYNGIIGLLHPNGKLKVLFIEEQITPTLTQEELCMLSEKECHIRNCILNEAACAACNGSKKDSLFGGHCAITDAGRSKSVRLKCSSNRWELNDVQTYEGYPFMMLLELIYKVSFKLKKGRL